MKRKIVVISNWKSKANFQQLKKDVEENITDVSSYFYILCVDQPKEIEKLPQVPDVHYLSKKDFTFFGKLKTPLLEDLLIKEKSNFLLAAYESESRLLKKVLKHSKLTSIGMEKETLPIFDLSFKKSSLKDGKLFKQINNYLTKIQ